MKVNHVTKSFVYIQTNEGQSCYEVIYVQTNEGQSCKEVIYIMTAFCF
jgi:hypothetical protein